MKRWTRVGWRTAALAGALMMVASVSGASIGGTPAGAVTGGNGIYAAAATFSAPPNTGTISEPLSALPLGLAPYGYVQDEYFAAGTAHAFQATAAPSDGRWTIVPTTAAAYRTRILVRMPKDPSHFSGTVVVEWMNESGGESAPDWDYLNPELMSAGDAYVAVSAQALGVEGGTPILGSATAGAGEGLVQKDPARYGTLHHPGDQYALDIFAQIGLALHSPSAHVLGALRPRHVVAVGESQSAFYLTTFADALQPVTHAFDGIFIHSRGGSGAPLNGSSITHQVSGALRIRTDLDVPVFMFETQTDLTVLGYAPAQQPNTSRIRTWEVAGTSHADAYLVGAAVSVLGCTTPVNTGPQHEVVQAAFAAFSKWVVHGTPPPSPPPFTSEQRETAYPGPRPLRQCDRRCPHAGRRRASVDPQRGAAVGRQRLLLALRVDHSFQPANAGHHLPLQGRVPRQVLRQPRHARSRTATSCRPTGGRCWPRPARCSSRRHSFLGAAHI